MELHILPEGAQSFPCGYKLEASDSNVGKRQKQAQHHEKPNDERLKRDRAALISPKRTLVSRERYCTFIPSSRR
jgi:hypothetical protein